MSLLHRAMTIFIAAVLFTASLACTDKEARLLLTPSELFRAAIYGGRVGACYISRGSRRNFCDLYVRVMDFSTNSSTGWPLDLNGRGSGCVKAPDFPKGMSRCFYSKGYGLSREAWEPFCTDSGVNNAVAQLRSAISSDKCFPSSESVPAKNTFNLNELVPETQIEGWNCGHSPGKGSCFVSTAKYVADVVKNCVPCLKPEDEELTQPTDSKPIETGVEVAKKCAPCANALRKAPKCGGKLFGIGSKRSGRSCKLIDGNGCWPKKSAPVLHDCGKGAECKFKISSAKAKVWCCRPKKKCKWFQAKCHWQNTFRCSNSALSKSKDKDGAQVLWE